MRRLVPAIFVIAASPVMPVSQHEGRDDSSVGSEEGLGRAHMKTSCTPTVSADFGRRWLCCTILVRARPQTIQSVLKNDPECAMAYWGAAMTYNHPFWDPPSQADEAAEWTLVQKGLKARKASAREKLYLAAVSVQGRWRRNKVLSREQAVTGFP